jgi:hypothetical protein
MNLQLTQHEIDVILDWVDFSISESQTFGGSHVLFPSERILLQKFTNNPGIITLNETELRLLSEMMETSILRKFGGHKYLFGFEQQLYQKINCLLFDCNDNSEV